jgi:glycosyltransferase involved in cell wall biosynthesis
MHNPTVSFVVPCYKLAHLLPECIHSILSQSYGDLEILIMDDCSPDDTAAVARSFQDPRVKHIRNEPNLGHLRNYNKGIGLSRGKYVWLISADDFLRRPYILERYVDLLDTHPNVGYVFCSGVGVQSGRETGILEYTVYDDHDRVIPGHRFLKKLLRLNVVLAASGLTRRECYDQISLFPLDMPWAGDWYLWCLFALYHDVGYFAEPMVCYREHPLSMTNQLFDKNVEQCCEEDVFIPWAIKERADESGWREVSKDCLSALSFIYAKSIASKRYQMAKSFLSLEQFEHSLSRHRLDESERNWIRAQVYAGMGNEYYWAGDMASARQFYGKALEKRPWMVNILAKRLLLSLGKPGEFVGKCLRGCAKIPKTLAKRASIHRILSR